MRARGWMVPLGVVAALATCAGCAPEGLGVKAGRLAPCPSSPNCVSSQETGSHAIEPLTIPGDPDAHWGKLVALLGKRSDTTIRESSADYARVEFRTFLGFVDDAEFLLDRNARVVHIRSASRLGYSDLGKNRRRIEEVREALGKEMAEKPLAGEGGPTPSGPTEKSR
jgi:uncharacterized protein (DUF1499 family)